jgi:uncharacterized protein YprB with RNaseH-like and TPR domain
MISDYEGIVACAKFSGICIRNQYGTCQIIDNILPTTDDIRHDEYYGLVFLDIETTGLSGADSPLFLIGLLRTMEGKLQSTQLLAREPAEEAAALYELLSYIDSSTVVLTFNGDSFDIPYIKRRMSYCDIILPEIKSIDLLKPARMRYKEKLASCSLQSLEKNVLNLSELSREGDIPGYKIPQKYWEYVNYRDYSILEPIIKHNIMDLISTARLWNRFRRP